MKRKQEEIGFGGGVIKNKTTRYYNKKLVSLTKGDWLM